MTCEVCNGTGWLEADGRLGHEIQHCQTCGGCKSDKEAYEKASLVMDTSQMKHDTF
jgi:7-cyano-7-deazaguanine synthase in queuosine biosynthesis